MKETYLAAGGERSNTRYGWLRTRAWSQCRPSRLGSSQGEIISWIRNR